MRMWMVPPEIMCRFHLQGEHLDLHMLVGNMKRRKHENKSCEDRVIDPSSAYKRHEELAREFDRRPTYNHASMLNTDNVDLSREVDIDIHRSLVELNDRCMDCTELMIEYVDKNPNSYVAEFVASKEFINYFEGR